MAKRPFSMLPLLILSWALVIAFAACAVMQPQPCKTDYCKDRKAWVEQASAQMIDEQLAPYMASGKCWKPGEREGAIPDYVLVANAAKDKAGQPQFDTTIVRKTTFDQAWALASAGKVWTLAFCTN